MARRVVITGLGAIAPNGIGKERYWNALVSGHSGIKRISRFDSSRYPVKIAGEVTDFNPSEYMEVKQARRLSRFAQFSLAASRMAIEDSMLVLQHENPYRMGIALGTAIGGLEICEKECAVVHSSDIDEINPLSAMSMNPNSALGSIAIEFKMQGPNMTISTGCSAGLSAIGYAYDLIQSNKADVVVSGGAEAPLLPVTFASFCSAHVLSKSSGKPENASKPFDKSRDGYVLGEGVGMIIAESLEHALQRNAHIYAEILGYGVTNDSYSIFKMEPDGIAAGKTIELALQNAGVAPEEIDYINAHGSSSVVSDKRETMAIKQVFGNYAYKVPISSIKSMVGQSLAATAGLQLVTTTMAVEHDCLPPTINYEEQDPECDLDYIPNRLRSGRRINTALINSFGAGGNNISMIIKKSCQQQYALSLFRQH